MKYYKLAYGNSFVLSDDGHWVCNSFACFRKIKKMTLENAKNLKNQLISEWKKTEVRINEVDKLSIEVYDY